VARLTSGGQGDPIFRSRFGFDALALDYGGLAFEDDRPRTLAEAMAALEQGLREWRKAQGTEVEDSRGAQKRWRTGKGGPPK
jgi:hypothetical protein